jgi:para-aminobenzoate synthetase
MLAQLTYNPPVVVAKDAISNIQQEFFDRFDGIVLSPGPGTPQEQPPLSHLSITQNPNKPILGVCLGHQLLSLAYGARVDRAPMPIHGQDHWIVQETAVTPSAEGNNEDGSSPHIYPSLFQDLPSSFRVVRYHSLCAYDLPNDGTLMVTAKSEDGVIQAIQHRSHPHYGVQFHPESIGTQYGIGLLENFVRVVEDQKHTYTLDGRPAQSNDGIPSSASTPSGKNPAYQEETIDSTVVKAPRFRVMMHQLSKSLPSVTPLQVFEKYFAHQSHAVWLDSSSFPSRGELDIMAAPTRPEDVMEYHRHRDSKDILTKLEEELFGAGLSDEQKYAPSDTIGWVKDLDSATVDETSDVSETSVEWVDEKDFGAHKDFGHPPFHYRGGFLGFLGYEVRHDTLKFLQQKEGGHVGCDAEVPVIEEADDVVEKKAVEPKGMPTAAFFLARESVVYHHPTETWYLIGLVEAEEDISKNLSWMKTVKQDFLNEIKKDSYTEESSERSPDRSSSSVKFVPNRSKGVYAQDISDCHEYIRMGESYELCLTNQLETRIASTRPSFDLYQILRKGNPSPYSGYFRWNVPFDDDSKSDILSSSSLVICSSSPERFMSVTRQRPHPEVPSFLQAEAKPIKGTCARVIPRNGICRIDSEVREDERRARSLELSLKNRAENLMIVDLLRNDMSRVCQIGTVHVAKLMDIESFATVHQMVSTIRGTLSDSATPIDLLRASFPGGSMTGAPKIRTMELLEKLERNVDRGPYAGSLGYISVNGCMDMNIIIRSAVMTQSENKDGWKISIGAGGAITALSEVQDEYDEMELKARAVKAAVQQWACNPEKVNVPGKLPVQNSTKSASVHP